MGPNLQGESNCQRLLTAEFKKESMDVSEFEESQDVGTCCACVGVQKKPECQNSGINGIWATEASINVEKIVEK